MEKLHLCDENDLTEIYNTLLRILENDNYKKLGSNALIFSKILIETSNKTYSINLNYL